MAVRDKMTKAELLAEIEQLEQDVSAARQAAASAKPAPVVEAVAIAQCVRALDTLTTRNTSYSYSSSTERPDTEAINRALRYFASKYGVPLVEIRTEPCTRPHLDAIDTVQLSNTIGHALTNAEGWTR